MARRYEVTDTQWEIIKPYLGNTHKENRTSSIGQSKNTQWYPLDFTHRSSVA